MPKQKTRKAISLRIKVTGSGKCKRRVSGVGHFLAKKSRKAKRDKNKERIIGNKTEASKYKTLMGC